MYIETDVRGVADTLLRDLTEPGREATISISSRNGIYRIDISDCRILDDRADGPLSGSSGT